jgi:hypothetical protein
MALSAYEAAFAALDSQSQEGDRMAWRREYLAVSPSQYPNLAAVAPFLADADADDQFETTLALILDAVAARAAG